MCRVSTLCLAVLFLISSYAGAQTPDYSQLDPKPYDPKTEPDIDMFISSYKESLNRHIFGSLLERDILTRCEGDPLRPKSRGAVLTNLKRFTHALLEAHTSTTPSSLKNEQSIFYIASGKGIIKSGGKTAELYEGIGVLMPPDTEFTMTNTGDEPLTMYIMTENIPEGFSLKKAMVVHDENVTEFSSSDVHWSHCYKTLFGKRDGLATLRGMGPVWFNPMTMGQPHSHREGVEEIWFSLRGDITILIGKQIRKFPPGTAYKIPPNGKTPHSTINVTDELIKVFWMMN